MKKIKSKIFFVIAAVVTVVAVTAVMPYFLRTLGLVMSRSSGGARTVIVDAGHGGMDIGGASESGLLEKDINLDVAKRLSNLLTLDGYNVIMTRESDGSADGGDRFIKKNDIKSRVALAEKYPDALFVSIHMNIFTDSKYWGAQMFHDGTGRTSALAERVQTLMRTHLQPDNNRVIKQIPGTVYLFSHIKNPAFLAECGFLSNTAEAEKLSNSEYKTKIAMMLFCGIKEYNCVK